MKNMILSMTMVVLGALSAGQAVAADKDTAVAGGSLQSAFSSWGKPSLQGDWKIVEDGGAHFIELSENFRAKKRPGREDLSVSHARGAGHR